MTHLDTETRSSDGVAAMDEFDNADAGYTRFDLSGDDCPSAGDLETRVDPQAKRILGHAAILPELDQWPCQRSVIGPGSDGGYR